MIISNSPQLYRKIKASRYAQKSYAPVVFFNGQEKILLGKQQPKAEMAEHVSRIFQVRINNLPKKENNETEKLS